MEQLVYGLVKDRPWLKDLIKKVYQGVFSCVGRYLQRNESSFVIRPNAFFGFHDKTPWSDDNSMLLAHQFVGVGNEDELANNPVTVAIYEGDEWQQPRVISQTKAWNWQQGSQLQWLGQNIIFNDFVDDVCVAVEYHISGELLRIHPFPVAAVSPCKTILASFCFESFGKAMPGYGYDFVGAKAKSNVKPDTLVLFSDLGEIVTEVSGGDIPSIASEIDSSMGAFVSHVLFNKSGNKVAFMRRVAVPGRRLRSALYIYDIASGRVTRAPFIDMVSHYSWLNDDEIFAYANTLEGDGYFRYNILSKQLDSYSNRLGWSDGHPNTDRSGNLIVFDTYPDKYRLQRLAVFNLATNQMVDLAKLFSPMKFWATKRVDLHPRFRADGKYICVDCSTSGKRSLATLKFEKECDQ